MYSDSFIRRRQRWNVGDDGSICQIDSLITCIQKKTGDGQSTYYGTSWISRDNPESNPVFIL